MMKIKKHIFRKLPMDMVDIILSYYYGPTDINTANLKNKINNFIVNSSDDIILNIVNSYSKTPELLEYNNDIWYDYSIGSRLPKLISN